MLTIDGGPVDERDHIFEEGVYLSIFNCLLFVRDRSTGMLEEQKREYRYPVL